MVPLAVLEHEEGRQGDGADLRRHHAPPDAVQLKEQGQQQNRADLEHQGPQEGDQGGDQAVVQCGKEGGAEDAEARKVAAESWKIEATHSSFAEMMENVDFDILAIGDYYGIRGERAIAGLKNGKHILSDKPLCTDLAELAEIRKLAAEKNLVIGEMLEEMRCFRRAIRFLC